MKHSFSVIIPLYNKAEYIERAVQSVLAQTHQDFEIIVVNDGSTDGGEELVKAVGDGRIILLDQKNGGVSSARNNGAAVSKYEYLAFLDADDVWLPGFLSEVSELITRFPQVGLYGTNNFFSFPAGKETAPDYSDLFNGGTMGILENYFGLFAKNHKSPFSNSNFCVPKKIFSEMGGYKIGVRLTEDSDLWCRIALRYDVAFSVRPLAKYHLSLEGSTHSIFEAKEFEVSKMLRNALASGEVPAHYITGVERLISFQKISLLKRAVLTENTAFVFKNIMDPRLFNDYFRDSVLIFFGALFPKATKYINKKLNAR